QCYTVAEASLKAAERLRRQRDLGDEDDRAATGCERRLARPDVHLGLAAAGRTGKEDVAAAVREQDFDPRERLLLRLREIGRGRLAGQTRRRRHVATFAAARRLLRRDQRERAGGRRAVVVGEPEGEIDERRREG